MHGVGGEARTCAPPPALSTPPLVGDQGDTPRATLRHGEARLCSSELRTAVEPLMTLTKPPTPSC
ncbi:hypothetical protein GN244_ATG18873 [Phytophthora infestans]|uniref:Uncharacterized protein n=1 Tax=Phytophthora infestans TaxID=4787 RepID=A0A833W5J9_PHYIN|nr:hypothetical protein GN244_ATG18873 [Phytophthora infestans]